MIHQSLGVCYYPEHWPETRWAEDAGMMRNIGLTFVRVGEFAWSRLEPRPRLYNFEWLRRAIDILHAVDLKVVLGTPTATPPKWLVDEMPDMVALDATGRPRKFGALPPSHYMLRHDTKAILLRRGVPSAKVRRQHRRAEPSMGQRLLVDGAVGL